MEFSFRIEKARGRQMLVVFVARVDGAAVEFHRRQLVEYFRTECKRKRFAVPELGAIHVELQPDLLDSAMQVRLAAVVVRNSKRKGVRLGDHNAGA